MRSTPLYLLFQFTNDLVSTYCSLHDDWQNNQHYNNLAVMFLELVTPEMDVDQIGKGPGYKARNECGDEHEVEIRDEDGD